MDATPNLSLPYIMAAQSQKHVTHNEAIRALDAILQLAVLDRDLTAPPGSPADGARYIVGASPTGAWSGHTSNVAAYQDGAWMFYAPVEGWIAWIGDEDVAVVWDGSAWSALTTGGGGGGGSGSYTTLGINATADTTNRLSLAADATLFNHDGDGHQLKINKASAADTVSLLYQDAFSGRAELGLAGDDDFHFKVSPDGTTWKEAILIDRSTGSVSFPHTSLGGGSGREVLTANRTYYVRTDGSDSNTGLANTSGGAFLTTQKAVDTAGALDLGIHDVTLQHANGTYTAGTILKALTGAGRVIIKGDTTTPSNVLVSVTSADCFNGSGVGRYKIEGVKMQTTTSGSCVIADGAGVNIELGANDYGACAGVGHIWPKNGGYIACTANYKISGGAPWHIIAQQTGVMFGASLTVTVTGTPAFANAFCSAYVLGLAY
ncbi:MAG: DUF2793 domain-containing protein, partial [Hyphomicrobium sp.]|nr:DUF2793 domain-containing protein [Hyphomicrobium sp.]